ncbi:MAG: acyltransferase [Asticcacaulis sp.]|uniref:acyltransferase family protein n=1 Tax=Asticcacaulis sp. TaxID=1872648 RepID=UPI0039E56712
MSSLSASRALGKLRPLQVLRAVAAIGVVFTHAITRISMSVSTQGNLFFLERDGQLRVGDAGVDIFFVLSGFIMLYVHFDDFGRPGMWKKFAGKRLGRIVPLYWLLTTAVLALILTEPQIFTTKYTGFDPVWIAGSYLFLPISSHANVLPILSVGWTLIYEMFFYACLAVVIGLPRSAALVILAAFLCGLVAIGMVYPVRLEGFGYYTSWLLMDFLLGIAIAWVIRQFGYPAGWAKWAMSLAGVAGLAATILWTPPEVGWLRFVMWGLPSALLVYGLCTADLPQTPMNNLFVMLGDASYSIYLIQVIALPAWAMVMRRLNFGHFRSEVDVCVLTLLTTVTGVVCWYLVERPLGHILKGARGGKPAVTKHP